MVFGLNLDVIAILFAAGALGTAVNALAGGGTLITFPAFMLVGVPSVIANASNAVAIFPGRLMVILAYRRELATHWRLVLFTSALGVTGGLAGAWLLLRSSDRGFLTSVPWLLLAATLMFLFDRAIARAAGSETGGPVARWVASGGIVLGATYGGFFGAGLGILMMPLLSALGVRDMQQLNAIKNVLVTAVTSVAVLAFVIAGAVSWPGAIAMAAGSVPGGWLGGKLARRVPTAWLRATVIAFGFAMSAFYFHKVYLA